MQQPDPFTYIAPTKVTAPKYAAIRAAADAAAAELGALFATDPKTGAQAWQAQHAGHDDKPSAYASINRVTKALYDAVQEHAPPSPDRSAAERCCRIARMAANEVVSANLPNGSIPTRIALENIYLARWQACAAIALGSV